MSSSVTWDQTVVSRTAVRGGRCRFATWRTVSDCEIRSYGAIALFAAVSSCQIGIDRKPCPCCSRLPVHDRTLPTADSKPSFLASQGSALNPRHRIVAAKINSLTVEESQHPFEPAGCLLEASRRRLEALSRQAEASRREFGVFSWQREASKLGIRSFRWVIRGFEAPPQIDRAAAHSDRSSVFSARSTSAEPYSRTNINSKGEQNGKVSNPRS